MSDRDTTRDVAVVGMACRFADAPDLPTFWSNVRQGRQSFTPITRWDHEFFRSEKSRANDKTYVQKGAFIDDVDSFAALEFGVAPKRVEVMDPQHRLTLEVTREALQDAGFEHANVNRRRVGTFLGVVTSEYRNLTIARSNALLYASGVIGKPNGQAMSEAVENGLPITAFTMPGTLLNMTAANVARQWKFGGPAFTIDAACTSSLAAIHDAVTHIRAGVCDAAVAGGVYLNLTPESLVGFSRIGAISRSGEMRPFDERADGFLQGDGCGIVILKRYDRAVADNDRIYAVIRGTGINNDGDSPGPMAPSRDGQREAVVDAYEDAGVSPKDVRFVSCHGTATPVGDPVEVGALRDVMADAEHPIFLGSVKANVGHTMGAAGVAGFIHATMAVHDGVITPQAGFETPHPKLELDEGPFTVPTEEQVWSDDSRIAGVSAFGFGGTNCHVVLENHAVCADSETLTAPVPVVLTASEVSLLADHARAVIEASAGRAFADIVHTLNVGRGLEKARLTVTASSTDEFIERLQEAAEILKSGTTSGRLTRFSFVGYSEESPKIAFMFPGQGAQRVGLLEDLYEQNDVFRSSLVEFSEATGLDIPSLLYPTVRDEAAEASLRETEVCQPVMAAVGLALDRTLRSYGVSPSFSFGHSLGEFAACAAGGLLTESDALSFVAKRGKFMAQLDVDDRGKMAAVMAAAGDVEPFLADGCVIANINHPTQTVISGSSVAVESTVQKLKDSEIRATELRVSHAFHSEIVAPVETSIRDAVAGIEFSTPQYDVFSAVTGTLYTTDTAAQTFVDHASNRVDFVNAIQHAAQNVDAFVEVGAGTTLTSFVAGDSREHRVTSLGGKKPDNGESFAIALAQLVTWGVDVDFSTIRGNIISLPPSPLKRDRYWARRDKVAPLDIPNQTIVASQGSPMANDVSSELVALFREQADILKQHADILAAQTAALTGQPVISTGLDLSKTPTVETPAITQALAEESVAMDVDPIAEVDVVSEVTDAVAAISAFPLASLKPTQGLVKDLGFDSLMFVDLVAELQKRFDGLVIPQTAFDQNSTIADIVTFIEQREDAPSATLDVATLPLVIKQSDWSPLTEASDYVSLTVKKILAINLPADVVEKLDQDVTLVDWSGLKDVNGSFDAIVLATDGSAVERAKQLTHVATLFGTNVGAYVHLTTDRQENPHTASAAGFLRALDREFPETLVKSLDIAADKIDIALPILFRKDGWVDAMYDGTQWLCKTLSDETNDKKSRFKKKDVVLVTGGTGAVGRVLVQEIATRVKKVVVLGRRKSSEAPSFPKNVEYVQTDFTDLDPMPNVTAIVHCAGVTRDGSVSKKSDAAIEEIFRAKVHTLDHVVAACKNAKTIICASSWSGTLGNSNQTSYSAANAYIDAWSELNDATSIAWPVWEGEGMGASIPETIKDAMKREGVTFITAQEGRNLFANLLDNGTTGHVLIAREIAPAQRSESAVETMNTETHPFVAEHVLRDQPVVPFAYAMELVAASSRRTRGWNALQFDQFVLNKGIELSSEIDLIIRSNPSLLTNEIELTSGDTPHYAARISKFVGETPSLPALQSGEKATLELNTFYDELAFHGPKLRAIDAVIELSDTHLIGDVMTSKPSEWIVGSERDPWTVDPKVVDGSFQLVLYFLRAKHGIAAFPITFDRYVQKRPFTGDTVRCSMTLESIEDGIVTGTIFYSDQTGVVAWMERLQARVFETGAQTEATPLEISPEHYDISKFPEVEELAQRLQMAELIGISNPYFRAHEGVARDTAKIGGREMINFSSYNYLGLSGHPATVAAAKEAIDVYGTSASASRVASGQIPLHEELEAELADLIKAEAALVFSAGHMTNETVIGHLFGKNDLIIHDALAHNSILTGAELSGAKRMSFPHNDFHSLDKTLTQLRGEFEKVGIFVEGVYSMDGDIPNLPEFVRVKNKHKCLLYVDEAHSIGVIGQTGAGIREYFDLDATDADVWMGTLSKAFASCGGYVAGSQALIDFLKYTAPAFVFSAGISPANAAAACAAVKEMKADPENVRALHDRSKFFLEKCKARGLDTGMSEDSAVIPVIVGNTIECLQLSERLAQRDINVQPIVYPAVDDSESRLRFFLSSTHTEQQLAHTADVVAEELERIQSGAAAE